MYIGARDIYLNNCHLLLLINLSTALSKSFKLLTKL